ncbi:MAG: T9SS type A sorting domain-containing protein [Saprospiraceae bacterium]|nr:T9SS type A sorting domain-containing protein [Saprospiraceae bacterium]
MQKLSTFIAFLATITTVTSQSFQQISTGTGYNKQSYIKLIDGSQKQISNDAWDLAFTAFGFQDAGIFINESSGSTQGQNLPLTELYYAKTDDFNASVKLDSIQDQKFLNSEESWNYGALNELRNRTNPFDYGWGLYNPSNNSVKGNKVFVIKLRNGEYRKLIIESLIGTTYNLKYAKLDGTGEVTKSLNKVTDNKGQKLMYFSFSTNNTVDVLPVGGFDLMYGRYISLAQDPNGTIVQQYNVTGVLTGPGILTAKATGVNPATVSYNDYKDNMSTVTDIIGFDWKTLSGTSWVIDDKRVFFVKTADNKVWKLRFIDFEGSATGNAVFEKTELGTSSVSELAGVNTGIFPNPVENELVVSLEVETGAGQLNVNVTDITGKSMVTQYVNGQNRFNALSFDTSEWNKGIYLVRISNTAGHSLVKKVVKM